MSVRPKYVTLHRSIYSPLSITLIITFLFINTIVSLRFIINPNGEELFLCNAATLLYPFIELDGLLIRRRRMSANEKVGLNLDYTSIT